MTPSNETALDALDGCQLILLCLGFCDLETLRTAVTANLLALPGIGQRTVGPSCEGRGPGVLCDRVAKVPSPRRRSATATALVWCASYAMRYAAGQ